MGMAPKFRSKLAGTRATVKGSMMGEMVMVESVAAAKKMAE